MTKQLPAVIFFSLLCMGTIFLVSKNFVQEQIHLKIYSFILFSSLVGVVLLFRIKKIKLDYLSVGVALFLSCLCIHNQLNSPSNLSTAVLFSFFTLYVFFRYIRYRQNSFSVFNTIIAILCFIQALYGLSQYFEIVRSSSSFPIVGSFDNPAGFAASLSVGFPFVLFLLNKSRWQRYLAILSIAVITISILLSESRAGIVTILFASILFCFYEYYSFITKWKRIIVPISIVLASVIFIGLILIKKDSASGRLLIWQVGVDMVKGKPFFGEVGTFKADYMLHQAEFFAANPDSKYAILADNVIHTFNEYLYIILEYGLVGLLLFLLVVIIAIKYNLKNNSPYLISLISILVFSLFSYPFRYPFVWLIMAYSLSQLAGKTPIIYEIKQKLLTLIKAFLIIGILFCGCILIKDIQFETRWKKLARQALFGKTEKVLPEYKQLHEIWNGNHLFLYNYGAELNYVKDYTKSIEILTDCENYFNDYDVQMLLADNYFNLGDWDKAENYYITASNMCPNRFIPLSQLSKIYEKKQQLAKERYVIELILKKSVKVSSPTVTRIKIQAKERLNQFIK